MQHLSAATTPAAKPLAEPSSRPRLVLFHGLASSPQEFGLIRLGLKGRGIDLQCPELPDYTLALDPVRQDRRQWREAARQTLDALSPGPVVLGGLCVGGMLAALTALDRPERVAGLVMLSPSVAYDGWGMSAIRHLRHLGYWTGLDRFFSVTEREPYGIRNDKIRKWVTQELQARAQSAVGPARVPLRALREADRQMTEVIARLQEVRCPLLIISAREDEITRLSTLQRLFDSLPQKDKELAVLENSYHMITIDNDRQEVADRLHDFTRRCAAARQPAEARQPWHGAEGKPIDSLLPLPEMVPA